MAAAAASADGSRRRQKGKGIAVDLLLCRPSASVFRLIEKLSRLSGEKAC